jgi:hypothetical protein
LRHLSGATEGTVHSGGAERVHELARQPKGRRWHGGVCVGGGRHSGVRGGTVSVRCDGSHRDRLRERMHQSASEPHASTRANEPALRLVGGHTCGRARCSRMAWLPTCITSAVACSRRRRCGARSPSPSSQPAIDDVASERVRCSLRTSHASGDDEQRSRKRWSSGDVPERTLPHAARTAPPTLGGAGAAATVPLTKARMRAPATALAACASVLASRSCALRAHTGTRSTSYSPNAAT